MTPSDPVPARAVYELRPASEADAELACEVKMNGLKPYVEQLSVWDDERQRAAFLAGFKPEVTQVISAPGLGEVGVLRVEDRDGAVFLAEIYLSAATRNRGIGSAVVRDVVDAAHRRGRAVRLQLLRPNPVRFLYARLGFQVTSETPTHFKMECPCPTTSPGVTPSPGRARSDP